MSDLIGNLWKSGGIYTRKWTPNSEAYDLFQTYPRHMTVVLTLVKQGNMQGLVVGYILAYI